MAEIQSMRISIFLIVGYANSLAKRPLLHF